ncbi:hypothetical protein V2J09_016960 [Rumex salicifolius]
MQFHDPSPNPAFSNPKPPLLDQPTSHMAVSSPIRTLNPSPVQPDSEPAAIGSSQHAETNGDAEIGADNQENSKNDNAKSSGKSNKKASNDVVIFRRERPSRACTARAKLYVEPPLVERRPRPAKKEKFKVAEEPVEEVEEEDEEEGSTGQCGKIVTSLVNPPPPGQMPRWNLRAMWELAAILNFLNVFRPLLNIKVEFSAEELETSLITPNNTLSDVHIPLLKAIPPVTRMACGRETWVTVLCRKLRDWWHWVAEGELPIVASHGAEIEIYKSLDPAVRVVILKALCDIRVEQEDIRNYIDESMKHGMQLSAFRKERIGGDSHGISYWYEDDAIIGHRLYREIRKVEIKKAKIKGSNVLPSTIYEWETVATNLDEFLDVSEKLFASNNRTEVSVGKKLKNDMLPEIEKIQKRKEKLLKKQQREALLLDNFMNMDGIIGGRSLRHRKTVTYTFDDYDRSINEAIKITKKKQPSPEPGMRRESYGRSEPSANGRRHEPMLESQHVSFSPPSPPNYDEMDEDDMSQQPLDRSFRTRQRPQRYSDKEFAEAVSDNDGDFDSDDEIVGEAVYDEEYLRKKRKKLSSSSEGDEEYHWSDENGEEEEEAEDEEEEYTASMSEDSDGPKNFKKIRGRTQRGAKLRPVVDFHPQLRRSRRSTRNRINYQQYEQSESDHDSAKRDKSNAFASHSVGSGNEEFTIESPNSEANGVKEERGFDQPLVGVEGKEEIDEMPFIAPTNPHGEVNEVGKRGFLDLNEAAPGSGFDDGPVL